MKEDEYCYPASAIQKRNEEYGRIKEAYLDMLNQACGQWRNDWDNKTHEFLGYDSGALLAFEDALELAVELGWIKKEEVLR